MEGNYAKLDEGIRQLLQDEVNFQFEMYPEVQWALEEFQFGEPAKKEIESRAKRIREEQWRRARVEGKKKSRGQRLRFAHALVTRHILGE